MRNWLLQLLGWERKTIAEIISPLKSMKDELNEALDHHNVEAVFHREQEAWHNNEAQSAIAVRDNLLKLLGGKA